MTLGAAVHLGRYDDAQAIGEELAGDVDRVCFAQIPIPIFHFYFGLTQAFRYPTLKGRQKRRARRILKRSLAKLTRFSKHGVENFEHKSLMLAAELARIDHDVAAAMDRYAQAETSARAHGFHHLAAMAVERLGTLALERGWPEVGMPLLRRAHSAYRNWGATSVAERLESEHTNLLTRPRKDEASEALALSNSKAVSHRSTTIASGEIHDRFDLNTILRISRAISQEVTLEGVLAKVMESSLETAGARRAALILVRGGRMTLAADRQIDEELVVYESLGLEEAGACLPLSLIQYVARSSESIVLADASSDERFANDPYVAANRSKSILASPVLKQNRLVAILYVENSLISGAFTEDRVEVLGHLSSQSAISLDSAVLYEQLRKTNEDLEVRVGQRTAELQNSNETLQSMNLLLEGEIAERQQAEKEREELNRQLVHASRQAGMAEIATGILHNVGNALNTVNVGAQLILTDAKSSHANRLAKVVALLAEHAEDLGHFLTEDERGSKVIPYLGSLADRLAKQHEKLCESATLLVGHVDHIVEIVQTQQEHARGGEMFEDVSAAEIIDAALVMCSNNVDFRGIEVATEIEVSDSFCLDRHKTLQILVNLISNAQQALASLDAPGCKLVVRVFIDGDDRVVFHIINNGPGIEPANLQKIFSHGFTTKSEGHGFGLHSSANAASEMGGSLQVVSEPSGRGATFVLTIPVRRSSYTRSA